MKPLIQGLTVYPQTGIPIPDYVRFYEPLDVIRHQSYEAVSFDYDVALVGSRSIFNVLCA